ncbi:transcriptional regulator, TetR family [Rhizobium sp. NFR07]|uniref:TetR/AcrR family transcriptional regulator n=1 Tax=Rhizobium sp. NFR07 TaxID=1566262 RepID=UPI0008E18728|nr:TetR/AcrR family transcriptional regulator [Rhizobium sp. NFR07]SFB61692.1 transcriptional regulator, TetR family [Rhizobium sp. NFR07]
MKDLTGLPLEVRILHNAFVVFTERGYENASMDEVALAAGTTKRTVYSHFRNKEALFRAAISQAIEWFLSELPKIDPDGDPEHELVTFINQFSDLSTWRRPVLLQRVVMSEADRLPELGRLLHEKVIIGAEQVIAEFLEARFKVTSSSYESDMLQSAGVLASYLLNMATGPQRVAALMEARIPSQDHPSVSGGKRDIEQVRLAVRFFLSGLASTA